MLPWLSSPAARPAPEPFPSRRRWRPEPVRPCWVRPRPTPPHTLPTFPSPATGLSVPGSHLPRAGEPSVAKLSSRVPKEHFLLNPGWPPVPQFSSQPVPVCSSCRWVRLLARGAWSCHSGRNRPCLRHHQEEMQEEIRRELSRWVPGKRRGLSRPV